MKRILLASIFLGSVSFGYEACGITKSAALNALSQSIYVKVDNKFQKKEKLTLDMFDTNIDKQIKNETTQTSSLTLKNVKYIKKDNEWCASVSKDDVQSAAKQDLKILLNYSIADLPATFTQKQKTIQDLLTKITFVKAVLNLSSYQVSKLTTLEKQLKDIANKGEVIFNVNIPTAKIKIAGINKDYSPSTPIQLPAGEYSYTIVADNKCPITGKFVVNTAKQTNIQQQLGDYPIITFTSNQSNVDIKLNGKRVSLNTPTTLKQCTGVANWQMNFEDQMESGEVEVSPNFTTTINKEFVSKIQKRKLKEKIDFYTHSKEITINYGYGFTTNDKNTWDEEKRIEVREFNNYDIYKLGFGILAGTKDAWTAKDMNELEIAISARMQLSEIGDTIFHISSFPLLPYVGIEGGWDMYKYIDEAEWTDANNIITIFRGTIGMSVLLHKQFGFNIEFSHDFVEKRDNIVSAGIILDF